MTEAEILKQARKAFDRRDVAAKRLQEIDNEIKELVKEYSIAMKTWGFTPVMLRNEVRTRLGLAA